MRLTREIQHGDRRITVKELTLAEIRAWLADAEHGHDPDVVGDLLFDDCRVSELEKFSDADPAALEAMTQSELGELVAATRELNPHFFALRARLHSLARRLDAANSNATSAT